MVIALYAVLLIAVGVIISRKVKGADDGFASGFMTGGIMAGASQVVSSGLYCIYLMSRMER